MIQKQCKQCGITYEKPARLANRPGRNNYCSRQCSANSRRIQIDLVCANCGREFTRSPVASTGNGRNKSKRNFCSSSCAAIYNNTHKTTGTRRSRLEAYLESQLRAEFPSLELICNGKDAIGSELDFYFPQLRLAIELNGIFHYEPIYGPDKLERIQANDQQKFTACKDSGIKMYAINTSTVKRTTSITEERYYTIIKDLVVRSVERASDTNVQVP